MKCTKVTPYGGRLIGKRGRGQWKGSDCKNRTSEEGGSHAVVKVLTECVQERRGRALQEGMIVIG